MHENFNISLVMMQQHDTRINLSSVRNVFLLKFWHLFIHCKPALYTTSKYLYAYIAGNLSMHGVRTNILVKLLVLVILLVAHQ